MTKRNKVIVAILIPALFFIVNASLFYCTTLRYEESFIPLYNSKVTLEKGNYSLYDGQKEGTKKEHFEIDAIENSKLQTIRISISPQKKAFFIGSSMSISLNGKKYQLLRTFKISKSGIYRVSIYNTAKFKTNIFIQNQNANSDFYTSILLYYAVSVLSIVVLLIVLLVLLVKSLRNKKKLL